VREGLLQDHPDQPGFRSDVAGTRSRLESLR
jgi:hypothetical protein